MPFALKLYLHKHSIVVGHIDMFVHQDEEGVSVRTHVSSLQDITLDNYIDTWSRDDVGCERDEGVRYSNRRAASWYWGKLKLRQELLSHSACISTYFF